MNTNLIGLTLILTNLIIAFQLQNDLNTIGNFLTNVIDFTFNITNCLHVIIVNNNEFFDVHLKELELRNVPIVLITSLEENTYNEQQHCDGYMILANDYEATHEMFVSKKYEFCVNKRILIVAFGHANNTSAFTRSVNLEGIDILLIEGINMRKEQSCANLKCEILQNANLIDNNLNNDITITNIRDKKLIIRWNTSEELQLTGKLPLVNWEPKFTNSQYLRAITFHLPPFVYYLREIGVYEGLEYRIFKSITKDWPVRYEVLVTNQSYFHLKKEVALGKQDVAFVSLWTMPIMKNTDITFPHSDTCITFLVPKPEHFQEHLMVYQPLTRNFWLLIIVLTVTVGIILTKNSNMKGSLGLIYTIRLLTVSGIPSHSYYQRSHFNIILLLWCILSLLITTAYISGLSSVLTYPRYTKNINTLADMVYHKTYWTAPDNDTNQTFILSPNVYTKEIGKRFVYEKSMKERIQYIMNGNMAIKVQASNSFLDVDLTENESKRLKILPECAVTTYLNYVLKKNSPYKKIFNKRIKRMIEHGLIKSYVIAVKKMKNDTEMLMRLTTKPVKCPEEITLVQLQGSFYVLYAGYVLASAVFLSERFYHKLMIR